MQTRQRLSGSPQFSGIPRRRHKTPFLSRLPHGSGTSPVRVAGAARDPSFSAAGVRPAPIFSTGPLSPGLRSAYISPRRQAITAPSTATLTTLDEIVDNFSLLEEWDDRYRYVIELGRALNPLPDRERTDANKVQ